MGEDDNGVKDGVKRKRSSVGLRKAVSPSNLMTRLGRNAKVIWLLRTLGSNPGITLIFRTVKEFLDDDCPQLAASLAYYALFSLFPLILGLIAIFSLMMDPADVPDGLVNFLTALLPGSEELVSETIKKVVAERGATGVGLLAVLMLLWSATGLFSALRKALNIAWGVKQDRPLYKQKLVDLAMVLAVGVLFILSLGSTVLSRFVDELVALLASAPPQLGDPTITDQVSFEASVAIVTLSIKLTLNLLPVILTFLVFSALYRFVPYTKVHFGDVWLGALVATGLMEIAKRGFLLYIGNFASYNLVYGSLAAVIVLLLWAYISAIILLLGAELSSECSKMFGSQSKAPSASMGSEGGDFAPSASGLEEDRGRE